MKKSLLSFSAVAIVAMLLASCEKESVLSPQTAEPSKESQVATVPMKFYASPQGGVRTTMQSDGQLVWTEGDQIKVFTPTLTDGSVFTLTEGAGKASGVFEGMTTEEGPYTAVYPASFGTTLSGEGSVGVQIPATQQYSSTGAFSTGTIPVVAYSDGKNLAFANIASFLKVSLSSTTGSMTVTKLLLESSDYLNGTYSVNPQTGVATYVSGGTRRITLECPGGVELTSESKDFYFCIPAGTLSSGFQIVGMNGDESYGVLAETSENCSKAVGNGKTCNLSGETVKISKYQEQITSPATYYYKYPTFTTKGNDEYRFKWELPRGYVIWFRPIIEVPDGTGGYQNMRYVDIVYNTIPYHEPHMHGYRVDALSISSTPGNISYTNVMYIYDARLEITQDRTWLLNLPNAYGKYKVTAKVYYKYEVPDPNKLNDGTVPKTLTIEGRLIKKGVAARTITLEAGLNEVCNYNTKILDLNLLKARLGAGDEIYVNKGQLNNIYALDTSESNLMYPSYCFAIYSASAQEIVVPEECYIDLEW